MVVDDYKTLHVGGLCEYVECGQKDKEKCKTCTTKADWFHTWDPDGSMMFRMKEYPTEFVPKVIADA
jgi:hypothetical protein